MEILGGIGSLLLLIGLVWTIISAFKTGGTLWGVLNLIIFVQPIIGIVSAAMKKAQWIPVILMLVGSILQTIGFYPVLQKAVEQMSK